MQKVLFVCLGNICRSPAAEGIFKRLITENQLQDKLECDSAGTSSYHSGESADARMINHASRRGYSLTSISRPFFPDTDFDKFDLIVAMDNKNYSDLLSVADNEEQESKVVKMVDYCKIHKISGVPDPYSGGPDGFEHVIDILEDACNELIKNYK